MYNSYEKIEDIVLRHSMRGMDVLRKYMKNDYCKEACDMILSWRTGTILLTTGFYVGGFAETDGPVGTVAMALALNKLGYHAVIVTDEYCRGYFELKGIDVEYLPIGADDAECEAVIRKYDPVGLISIERCGSNIHGDYANMRGISIKENTAPCDRLFDMVYGTIPTIAIGDGGNEIGMGNVSELISEKLALVPCTVKVDKLVIATVSNWGSYGIVAYMSQATNKKLLLSFEEILDYIEKTVEMGCVDGVTKENVVVVDGFGMDIEEEIVSALHDTCSLMN